MYNNYYLYLFIMFMNYLCIIIIRGESTINMENTIVTENILPVLALRGFVMMDKVSMTFDVGRKSSIEALKKSLETDKKIFLVAQKDLFVEKPSASDLYSYGVVASISQTIKNKNGDMRVQVQGEYRAKIVDILKEEPFIEAVLETKATSKKLGLNKLEAEALVRVLKFTFENYSMHLPKIPHKNMSAIMSKEDPVEFFYQVIKYCILKPEDKQNILECNTIGARLNALLRILQHECDIFAIEKDIYDRVKSKMDQNQKEYFLREQIKIIQAELGDYEEEIESEYYQKVSSIKNISDASRDKLFEEVKRLQRMPQSSQEANVIRSYLDICLKLPFDKSTKDILDVSKARKILDKDHYGLKKVKERILELIAVRKLTPDIKGQIICLVGPPGVGKTSIAKSIAKTLNRRYVRVSLGGVRDESDIRGHRKTYIGAMPGRIINALIQSKSKNPLMLLDEIDKMGYDFKGDPSSAMLEVLDIEQNSEFRDHYVEIPFDLSQVLFLMTANDISTIPKPLLDRMEVIELSSYTREEKFNICKKYLTTKQIKRHGLTNKDITFTQDGIYTLIDGYTKESGVRTLERTVAKICRKVAKEKVEFDEDFKKVNINSKVVLRLLGSKKYRMSHISKENQVGLVTGLAWTSVGGETLEIEACAVLGSGKIQITGNLGKVMNESASIAVGYVRQVWDKYGINRDFYKEKDLFIHAPEGAVPKDGPSAGVTITTALISALSGIPVKRDIAMTGEISLRGRVMAIGGLKEKSIAGYRAGIKTIIIPYDNKSDIDEFDDVIKENINFIPVKTLDEVLDIALDIENKPVSQLDENIVISKNPQTISC